MSFINFESAAEKEQLRQELREARDQLMKNAEERAQNRSKRELDKQLRGEHNWIHPSVLVKIETSSKKKSKSTKKTKRDKKDKKSKKEKKLKKHKEKKKRKKKVKSESSDSSSDEELIRKTKRKQQNLSDENDSKDSFEDDVTWFEKPVESKGVIDYRGETEHNERDAWMTEGMLLKTYSKNPRETKIRQTIDNYDPSNSSRELNPHWKINGTGLPAFQRPQEEDDDNCSRKSNPKSDQDNYLSQRNWGKGHSEKYLISEMHSKDLKKSQSKKTVPPHKSRDGSSYESNVFSGSESEDDQLVRTSQLNFLTDQQMNELGAKLIKAEMMGNAELAKKLSEKLTRARKQRSSIKSSIGEVNNIKEKKPNTEPDVEHILLTTTDSKGITRPLPHRNSYYSEGLPHRDIRSKWKRVETHANGERVRYFPDDDRYDIKQMFEREKYTTAQDNDLQFAEITAAHKNSKDDLEDVFADKVRKHVSKYHKDEKDKKQAVRDYEELTRRLDHCQHCIESSKMEKQLLICMGKSIYLSLPWYEGLQRGHCVISTIQHVSCSTLVDEDTWAEIEDFRNALTRMFKSRSQDVIFFETARYLNRKPHLVIHCVPSNKFDMAPFYFKKAIQESEQMWSTNKQLILLKDRDIRRAIPRGLPYFWVHFGVESGFAHVIEDLEKFPASFAQEIIGGMLRLNPNSWRKPRREYNPIPKVKQFAEWWTNFDCTKND